jgi:hypothetical protein
MCAHDLIAGCAALVLDATSSQSALNVRIQAMRIPGYYDD